MCQCAYRFGPPPLPTMTRQPPECTCSACPIHANPLARARRAAAWTQKEAARIVGCHPNHIADIEYGRRNPSRALLAKMRDAYSPHLDTYTIATSERGWHPK